MLEDRVFEVPFWVENEDTWDRGGRGHIVLGCCCNGGVFWEWAWDRVSVEFK